MISPAFSKTLTNFPTHHFAPAPHSCPDDQAPQDRFTPIGDLSVDALSAQQRHLQQQQRLNSLTNRHQQWTADLHHLNAEGKAGGPLNKEDSMRRMHDYNRLNNDRLNLQADVKCILPDGGRMGGLDSPLFVDGRHTTKRKMEIEQQRDLNRDGVIG